MNVFNRVDEIMLKQLEDLDKANFSDKNFVSIVNKAKTVALLADKVIQSQVAQLKMDIWSHSKKFRTAKQTAQAQASCISFDDERALLEE